MRRRRRAGLIRFSSKVEDALGSLAEQGGEEGRNRRLRRQHRRRRGAITAAAGLGTASFTPGSRGILRPH